jgi:hypothetical protein
MDPSPGPLRVRELTCTLNHTFPLTASRCRQTIGQRASLLPPPHSLGFYPYDLKRAIQFDELRVKVPPVRYRTKIRAAQGYHMVKADNV